MKLNTFSPAVVLFCLYGPQSSMKKKDLEKLWQKYFSLWKKYIDQGHTLIIGGDLNCAVGTELGLVNNDSSKNKSGEMLIKAVKELNLHVMNRMEPGDHRTHVDRSSESSSRCLDCNRKTVLLLWVLLLSSL